jgi:hypothetical protein
MWRLAKQLAVFGQNQAASDSLKQANAKGVFDGIELLASTGGGEPKLFRRVVDIVFFGNCHKRGEIIELHLWPVHLVHPKCDSDIRPVPNRA